MDARVRNNIIKANIELLDENKALKEDKEILQRRIDRALDYIELIQYNESYGVKEKDYLELVDILKGDYINE